MSRELLVLAVAAEVKMSTLARIVKKHAGLSFAPFDVPEIGAAKELFEDDSTFTFPSVDSLDVLEQPPQIHEIDDEFASDISAADIVGQAREEAAKIIEQAEKDCEAIEQAAREKGMQFAQNAIDAEVENQMNQSRLQLTNTIEQIAGLNSEITAGAESQLVELAIEIAQKIVAREVTIDREIALTLVKVSLKRLNSRTVARVHLNPEDFAFVQSHREKLDFHGSLEFVEDRSISVGGCLIRTDTGDIDARIESQFDEIAHGLLGI
jgi:flagellar assembly protein FliH